VSCAGRRGGKGEEEEERGGRTSVETEQFLEFVAHFELDEFGVLHHLTAHQLIHLITTQCSAAL
jgi:hypothetical protein